MVLVPPTSTQPSEEGPSESDVAYDIEPKHSWMRDEAAQDPTPSAEEKMLRDSRERYGNMAKRFSFVAVEVWTMGEDRPVAESSSDNPHGPRTLKQYGLQPTALERDAVSTIAPIDWESTLRPMMMVRVTEKSQIDRLGALPSVYLLDIYPEGPLEFPALGFHT